MRAFVQPQQMLLLLITPAAPIFEAPSFLPGQHELLEGEHLDEDVLYLLGLLLYQLPVRTAAVSVTC
jgi:hypothetical protein